MVIEYEKTIQDYYNDLKIKFPKEEIEKKFRSVYFYDPTSGCNVAQVIYHYQAPSKTEEYIKFRHACTQLFKRDYRFTYHIEGGALFISDEEFLG
jgi:hypothetical protein